MARFSPRRPLMMETLERRELLSVGTAAIEQYALEQLNRARTNPSQVAQDVTSNLTRSARDTFSFYNVNVDQVRNEIGSTPAVQPLAWNDDLAQAADRLSRDMAVNGFQSHVGSDGSSIEQRISDAGYNNRASYGENAFAYADSVDQAMQAFLVDYGNPGKGHRNNIYNDSYREVGISINAAQAKGVGPEIVVQNFGSQQNEKPYLLGVVYQDNNHDNAYQVGEGTDQLTISVTPLDGNTRRPTGPTIDVAPWGSGGYQVQLDPGLYRVVAHQGDRTFRTQEVNIGSDNVKVDFDLTDTWQQTPTPTPAPTPQPQAQPQTQNSWTGVSQTQSAPTPTVKATPKTLAFTWANLSWKGWNARS